MDSFLAEEMNPQVFTMSTSASSGAAARRHPARSRAAIIRSESTWFFAQPRLSTWKARAGADVGALHRAGVVGASVLGRDLEDIPARRRVASPGDPAGRHLSEIAQLEIPALDAHAGRARVREPDRHLLPGGIDGELLPLLEEAVLAVARCPRGSGKDSRS